MTDLFSATDATLRQGLADTASETVREACALRLALVRAVGIGHDDLASGPEPGDGDR